MKCNDACKIFYSLCHLQTAIIINIIAFILIKSTFYLINHFFLIVNVFVIKRPVVMFIECS